VRPRKRVRAKAPSSWDAEVGEAVQEIAERQLELSLLESYRKKSFIRISAFLQSQRYEDVESIRGLYVCQYPYADHNLNSRGELAPKEAKYRFFALERWARTPYPCPSAVLPAHTADTCARNLQKIPFVYFVSPDLPIHTCRRRTRSVLAHASKRDARLVYEVQLLYRGSFIDLSDLPRCGKDGFETPSVQIVSTLRY
jgi:hypothetical protein